MRAYIESVSGSTNVDEINRIASVTAYVGTRLCAVVRDRDTIPVGMTRIPLQTALSHLERDGTDWVEPSTSTEGRKIILELRQELLTDITTRTPPTPVNVSLAGTDQSTGRRSLMDVHRNREAKRERMERWD